MCAQTECKKLCQHRNKKINNETIKTCSQMSGKKFSGEKVEVCDKTLQQTDSLELKQKVTLV